MSRGKVGLKGCKKYLQFFLIMVLAVVIAGFLSSCQSQPSEISAKAMAEKEMAGKKMDGSDASEDKMMSDKKMMMKEGEETAEAESSADDEEKNKDEEEAGPDAYAEHEALFAENRFPSAATCRTCHPKQYKEWSVSQHSYAQLSPVYLSLNNKINQLTNGTNGDFCLRCHSPVGANLGESSYISNLERHPTSREGITCVVCHRLNKAYNKVSGRLALAEGDILTPVFGPTGNRELGRVLDNRDQYRVVTKSGEKGRKIHNDARQFATISTPTFCGTCHDVTLFNGFRLEEAFSEYRLSPAAKKGVTCQDCHMGKIQGIPSGYDRGPAAVVGGKPTKPRKVTSHFFAGPDYSVLHPGIFPHNSDAQELATLEEWLKFDYKAGWGTDEFEDNVQEDAVFPNRWDSATDRYDAREIIEVQLKRLALIREKRLEVLRHGYHQGNIVLEKADKSGVKIKVQVKNGTDGHNVPTGFTGERLVWLHVEVTDREGTVIFQSGDLDPNGDLRDVESSYVHNGEMPLDTQLFNLQSRFVVENLRGGGRERVIPIPYPQTAIPFIRPSVQSLILSGEPTTERSHRKGIEPLGHRWANYKVDGDALTGKGPYKAKIELKVAMAPANLIAAIQDVGFDFFMSAREIGNAVGAGHEVLWKKDLTFNIAE